MSQMPSQRRWVEVKARKENPRAQTPRAVLLPRNAAICVPNAGHLKLLDLVSPTLPHSVFEVLIRKFLLALVSRASSLTMSFQQFDVCQCLVNIFDNLIKSFRSSFQLTLQLSALSDLVVTFAL